MNIPKYAAYGYSDTMNEIYDMCASDSLRTCETCDCTVKECKECIDATIWLEIYQD